MLPTNHLVHVDYIHESSLWALRNTLTYLWKEGMMQSYVTINTGNDAKEYFGPLGTGLSDLNKNNNNKNKTTEQWKLKSPPSGRSLNDLVILFKFLRQLIIHISYSSVVRSPKHLECCFADRTDGPFLGGRLRSVFSWHASYVIRGPH